MNRLVLLPGTNGHASASQRREAHLLATRDHLMSVIAVLVTQLGGSAIVPASLLLKQYDLGFKADEEGNIVYTAAPIEVQPETEKDSHA